MFRFKALFVIFGILGLLAIARADGSQPVSTTVAQYSVPVPQALQAYSQFTITNVQDSQTGNQVTYSYNLPAQLVGPIPQTVTLSGTVTPGLPILLQGDHGTAACALAVSATNGVQNVSCQVQYKNILVDPDGVKQFLTTQISDPAELAARIQVAAIFAKEPVGILTFSGF